MSQLYLIELVGLLAGLGLLELWHLIYPRLLTGFDMLVYLTNLSLMGFQVRYLVLFQHFSVIDGFEWSWMESLHNWSILFLLYINDLPDDVICHIAIYADDVLLSVLSVIMHLICGNNLN